MKFVLVGDIHVSDKAPRSRLDDYTEAVFEKIEEINEIADDIKASAILQCGDFFHMKSPSRVSHRIVQRAIRTLSRSVVLWVIVPGNHDLSNGDLKDLARQPLGTLYESGAAYMPIPEDLDFIEDELLVSVHGAQFTYEMDSSDENREVYYPQRNDAANYSITVSHGTVIHGMDTFFVDYTNPRMFDLDRCADVMFNGHLHAGFDDEVLYDSTGRMITFVNPGSVMRGSLDEYNRDFRPKVKILTLSDSFYTIEDRFLESAKPADEVLAYQEKEDKAEQDAQIAQYVDKLSSELEEVEQVSTYGQLVDIVNQMELSDKVKRRTVDLLEEAYEATN